MLTNLELIKRLFFSTILGGIIGVEREYNNRPAGFRTHLLVTIGSTLIMIISIDGVNKVGLDLKGDPYRLAAQVVSGIGFLGAGTIMKTGNSIEGLTTAASLWVCAGIGLAVGTGHLLGAVITEIIVLLTLTSRYIDSRAINRRLIKSIEIIGINRESLMRELWELFQENNVIIEDMYVEDTLLDNKMAISIRFKVRINRNLDISNLIEQAYEVEGIKKISFEKSNKN